MSTTAALLLFAAVTAYAVFGGADFGAGFWDLVAGGTKRGPASAPGDRPLDRAGVGGQPRLAHLLLRAALDLLPRGVRVHLVDLVRAVGDRGARHRDPGGELRVPQGRLAHPRPADLRRGVRPLVGAGALLPGQCPRLDRVRARADRRGLRRPVGQLAEPDLGDLRHPGGLCGGIPRRGLPRLGRGPALGRHTWSSTSGVVPSSPPSSPGRPPPWASWCCTATPSISSTG